MNIEELFGNLTDEQLEALSGGDYWDCLIGGNWEF